MKELLNVENLTVNYPGFKLDNVSFKCGEGEVLGIIGVNGAGKSTAIKAIMHIISRAGGNIYWKGEALTPKMISKFREQVGYVGDNDCYYPNIKVKKILKIMSGLYSNWDNETMLKYIDQFHLDTNKKVKELSTGMRVKLDLLMAMSHAADIYILDEPTSGLDPVVRKELLEILDNLAKRENKAVIISSHITSDLEKIAKRVIYIVDGKIELDESVEAVQKRYVKLDTMGAKVSCSMEGCLKTGNHIITTRDLYHSNIERDYEFKIEPVLLEDVLFYLGGY